MLYSGLRTLLIVPLMLVHAAAQSDTLLDIYDLALKNDPVLQAAQASYRAGQETEVQGRSALLPQVGAQAVYGETDLEQRSSRTFTFGGANIPSNTDQDLHGESEDYYLTLSQNIFNAPAWFSFKQINGIIITT